MFLSRRVCQVLKKNFFFYDFHGSVVGVTDISYLFFFRRGIFNSFCCFRIVFLFFSPRGGGCLFFICVGISLPVSRYPVFLWDGGLRFPFLDAISDPTPRLSTQCEDCLAPLIPFFWDCARLFPPMVLPWPCGAG